jgi:hypothetical protein
VLHARAQYANRMNIKLLRLVDFNERLREHGVNKTLTVQKICTIARDETEMRQLLDEVWTQPSALQDIVIETVAKNRNVFDFEHALLST